MIYVVDGRKVDLDQSTILGKGGEATVHRDPAHPHDKAIKIYHEPSPARADKIGYFVKHGTFPPTVMAPQAEVRDSKGKVVGFVMPQLGRRYKPAKELFTPSFCQNNGFTTAVITETMLTAGENLLGIHPRKFIVGDLNDGGIMVHEETHEIAWVDVDSWSTEKYPCIVGTQLYLCPALYGIDLAKGDCFEPWHDWYSFAVLLFRALLRKHPFKAGTHPQYPGVKERAVNGITLLDSSVQYPDVGLRPEMLSDPLADALISHLKMKERGPFPMDLLKGYRAELAECSSCHVWYPTSRTKCPQCTQTTAVDLTKVLGFEVVELIEAAGRILHLQLDGQTIYCVAEEAGNLVLYKKDDGLPVSKLPLGVKLRRGMQFGIFRGTLVICIDDDASEDTGKVFIFEVSQGGIRPLKQTTTGVLLGRAPVFATSRRFLYRTAQNVLLRAERFGQNDLLERPVATISQGQCWFACDPNPGPDHEVVFGFNRDVRSNRWFVCLGDREGRSYTTLDVPIPQLDSHETMLDLSIRFSDTVVLLMRKTRQGGKEVVRLERVDAKTGALLSSEVLDPANHPQWENLHGKAFAKGVVMHATDGGIVREGLDTHQSAPLRNSGAIVNSEDLLQPFGAGILTSRFNRVSLIKPN